MSNFLSFIVTSRDIYALDSSNSHTDIIEHHGLEDNPTQILKVEITPLAAKYMYTPQARRSRHGKPRNRCR